MRPAKQVDETVDGGELAAQDLLALLVADTLDAADIVDRQHARGTLWAGVSSGLGYEEQGVKFPIPIEKRRYLLPDGSSVWRAFCPSFAVWFFYILLSDF